MHTYTSSSLAFKLGKIFFEVLRQLLGLLLFDLVEETISRDEFTLRSRPCKTERLDEFANFFIK